jgi:hypothetical protein
MDRNHDCSMSEDKMIPRDISTEDEGLDDLRKAIKDARVNKTSSVDLLHEYHKKLHDLERIHLEFAARMDSAFPGADLNRHREDHDELLQSRLESERVWKDMKTRVLSGIVLAFVAVLTFLGLHSILTIMGMRLL